MDPKATQGAANTLRCYNEGSIVESGAGLAYLEQTGSASYVKEVSMKLGAGFN